MRLTLVASAALAMLGGSAFAGSLPQQTFAPTTVTTYASSHTTGGGTVSSTVQVGPVGTAASMSVKASLLVAGSFSATNQGFTVP